MVQKARLPRTCCHAHVHECVVPPTHINQATNQPSNQSIKQATTKTCSKQAHHSDDSNENDEGNDEVGRVGTQGGWVVAHEEDPQSRDPAYHVHEGRVCGEVTTEGLPVPPKPACHLPN